LKREAQKPDFWKDKEMAAKISKEISDLEEEVEGLVDIKAELDELAEISQIAETEEKLEKEIEQKLHILEKKIIDEEFKVFLSGKYDKGNAVISIYSGAGGQDAEDWATMLLRMYERFCSEEQFKTKVLHQSFGEGGGPEGRIGTKSVTLEVKGSYAYGILKNEAGVHRLVRLSPFSSQSLRHTSFALVEILPEISKSERSKIKIKPEDLKLETFRASGPGGQHVNRRESAVRIIHIPTGIRVTCQAERFQGLNRQKAEDILYNKLYQAEISAQKKEIKKIKGTSSSASWGKQIRSYVFHPYKLVKDYRTNVETSKVEEVLDGNLNEFIKSEIKLK